MKNNEKGRTFIISIDNMIEESVLIWMEVKNAAPSIIKAGGNPIEVINRGCTYSTHHEVLVLVLGEEPELIFSTISDNIA